MDKRSREETIIAFNVYCKIPFKNSSKTHPTIIQYAKILGRTPSALNMKIGNIGRLDPDLREKGIVGLVHGAKMEQIVWEEFYGNPEKLAFESERLVAQFSNQSIEVSSNIQTNDLPQGKEREIVVRQRVNQSFFRSAVMSAYNFCCCVSGTQHPDLLEACHIIDWSKDIGNRTNPKNGLCMNPFFHKAYDKYLFSITPDLKIDISDELIDKIKEGSFKSYIKGIHGKSIILPDKFYPQKEFLDRHFQKYKTIC